MNDSAYESMAAEHAPIAGRPIPWGIEPRVALLLVRLGNLLGEVADERLARTGIAGRGYGILAILSDDGPESQFELAQMLGKAPGVIVTAVDQLERGGLVERNRDPNDRRRTRVTLTADGRQALARADEIAEETLAELFGGLDGAELAKLKRLIRKGLKAHVSSPSQ